MKNKSKNKSSLCNKENAGSFNSFKKFLAKMVWVNTWNKQNKIKTNLLSPKSLLFWIKLLNLSEAFKRWIKKGRAKKIVKNKKMTWILANIEKPKKKPEEQEPKNDDGEDPPGNLPLLP